MCQGCEYVDSHPWLPPQEKEPTWTRLDNLLKDFETRNAEEQALRQRLYTLKCEIQTRERHYAGLQQAYLDAISTNWSWSYPPIPPKAVRASSAGEGLPTCPGVYFIWRNGGLAYVGQSKCVRGRCNLAQHEHLQSGDEISWLPFPQSDVLIAESFYIGIGRPWANFGFHSRTGRRPNYHYVSGRSTNEQGILTE